MNPPASFRATWLLALFLLAQAVPVVALAATDGMAGMACCRHGRDSCCRRKPMQTGTSLRAGHPCGLACAGTPTLVASGGAAVLAPLIQAAWPLVDEATAGEDIETVWLAAGYDPARFQRPPPVSVELRVIARQFANQERDHVPFLLSCSRERGVGIRGRE